MKTTKALSKLVIKKVTLFDFPQASKKDINLIIKSPNPKKGTGPDEIPIKVIKTGAM